MPFILEIINKVAETHMKIVIILHVALIIFFRPLLTNCIPLDTAKNVKNVSNDGKH